MGDLSKRLESLRLPGEKKSDFSRRIGIDPNSLSRYLHERTEPSLGVIYKVAQSTGVSVDWLRTGEGEKYTTWPGGAKLEKPLDNKMILGVLLSYVEEIDAPREERNQVAALIEAAVSDPALRAELHQFLGYLKAKVKK